MSCNTHGKRVLDEFPESGDTTFQKAPPKRRRSRSMSSSSASHSPLQNYFSLSPPPPPSAYELDRLQHHITLQDFGTGLQKAANAVFGSAGEGRGSRYERVDVLMLSWEEEDPQLPVSIEIEELGRTFTDLYGYHVEEWLIPAENCHNRLQGRILEWLGKEEGEGEVLKIVYYAGHGKLTNHGQLAWTRRVKQCRNGFDLTLTLRWYSWRNSRKERCPTIKWSGIQNTLEESRSDVLILLDCCSSGVCTSDEGNGVTELIAACAYNSGANGVGPFSFTHALNAKLKQMAVLPYFTVGHLYNAIFTEIQGWRIEEAKHRKVPVHLVLSQNAVWPRSIRLPKFLKSKGKGPANATFGSAPCLMEDVLGVPIASVSSQSSIRENGKSPLSQQPSPSSPGTSISPLPEYPRLLLSIRLSEDVKPDELSTELFADWFRSLPVSADLIRVEAGFASDSTIVLLSMPSFMLAYLPVNPAITLLGTARSRNLLLEPKAAQGTVTEDTKMKRGVEGSSTNTNSAQKVPSTTAHEILQVQRNTSKGVQTKYGTGDHVVRFPVRQYLNDFSGAEPQAGPAAKSFNPLSSSTGSIVGDFSEAESHQGMDRTTISSAMTDISPFDHQTRTTISPTPEVSITTFINDTELSLVGCKPFSLQKYDERDEIEDPFFGVDFTAGFFYAPQPSTSFPVRPSPSLQPNTSNPASLPIIPSSLELNRPSQRPKEDATSQLSDPTHNRMLSPGNNIAASSPGSQADDDEGTSVYSLPIDGEKLIVLAEVKHAHLSLNGAVLSGDIPEGIGYEMYKLGTLIQALNTTRPVIHSGWWGAKFLE